MSTRHTARTGKLVDPAIEAKVQPLCEPISNWQFTLGTGYKSRAVTGSWGSLSIVTGPFSPTIVTKASVALLNGSASRPGRTSRAPPRSN